MKLIHSLIYSTNIDSSNSPSHVLARNDNINTTYSYQATGSLVWEREIKSSHSQNKVLGICEQNPEAKAVPRTLYFLCQKTLSFFFFCLGNYLLKKGRFFRQHPQKVQRRRATNTSRCWGRAASRAAALPGRRGGHSGISQLELEGKGVGFML